MGSQPVREVESQAPCNGGNQAGGKLLDPKKVKKQGSKPVKQNRLFKPGSPEQSRGDKITAFQHFAGDLRVARLVWSDQPDPPQLKKEQQVCEQRQQQKMRDG